MTDHMEIRHLPTAPGTPDAARAPAVHGTLARPVGRAVVPVNTAGRRGFMVLLVSGLAINAWALFPSAVESGVYVPLPQMTTPSVAEGNSAPKAIGDDVVESRTATFFKQMNGTPRSSGQPMYRNAPYYSSYSPAAAVAMVPLRSKLEALLMLLYSSYGEDMDTAALELKLRQLLRLPDAVLAQLIRHPDLAQLNVMLDSVFLASGDLSGIQTELNKIAITSTAGPTEQIDVVRVNGQPSYVVYSAPAQPGGESVTVMSMSAIPQPPAEFRVVSAVEAPAVVAAFAAMAPVESFAAPVPAPAIAEAIGPAIAAPVVTEVIAPPTVTAFVAPPVVTEFVATPTLAPETFTPETFAPEPVASETFTQETFTSASPTTPGESIDVAPPREEIGKLEDAFGSDEGDAGAAVSGGGPVSSGGGDSTPSSQHGAPPSMGSDDGADDSGNAGSEQDSPGGSDSGGAGGGGGDDGGSGAE